MGSKGNETTVFNQLQVHPPSMLLSLFLHITALYHSLRVRARLALGVCTGDT